MHDHGRAHELLDQHEIVQARLEDHAAHVLERQDAGEPACGVLDRKHQFARARDDVRQRLEGDAFLEDGGPARREHAGDRHAFQDVVGGVGDVGRGGELVFHLVLVEVDVVAQHERHGRAEHERRKQPVALRDLADHDQRPDGRVGHAGEEGGHADQRVGPGLGHDRGREHVPDLADRAAGRAAEEKRRREHASGQPRPHRERGGEHLAEEKPAQKAEPELAVDGQFQPAVAAAEDLREVHAEDAHGEPADDHGHGVAEAVLEAAEYLELEEEKRADEDARPKRYHQGQGQVERQLHGVFENVGRRVEDGFAAEEKREQRVRDHGRDDGREQGLGLEVLGIEHLHGGEGSAERGAEDRAEAPGRAGEQQDAALARGQVQQLGEKGPEARAELGDGAFLAGAAARGDGGDGRCALDQGHERLDDAGIPVERLDHRVRAVGRAVHGLGDEARDEQARDEAHARGEDRDQPGAVGAGHGMDRGFAGGVRQGEAGAVDQEKTGKVFEAEVEQAGQDAGADAGDDAEGQPAHEPLAAEAAQQAFEGDAGTAQKRGALASGRLLLVHGKLGSGVR
ncbi:hypothetical protein DSECCO2_627160 [anaerobic digester metagenome]